MNIRILHLIDGAREARGLTVVIDVFRAFSLAAYAFAGGVEKIIPVGNLEDAWKLRQLHPDWLLAGERDEVMVKGFDFGNSPFQIKSADLAGKTLIHTTSAGTQGIVNAVQADEILTGSFVNAGAVTEYIRQQGPENVSLVCMGYSARYEVEEDNFCAEYIRNSLEGRNTDFSEMVRIIRKTSGARFFDTDRQHITPKADFDLCLDLNRFDFVIRAVKNNDCFELGMIKV
jgi:2-phosphosulfolactate phosphatase